MYGWVLEYINVLRNSSVYTFVFVVKFARLPIAYWNKY